MPFQPTQPSTWNVVIADDEPDSVGIVEYVLRFHKACVRTANSGQACIALLTKEMPDLLILDVQMPQMSGWDVVKHIRNEPKMKDLVVIAMTAHAMYGDRERILSAGFNLYLPKPLSPMTLIGDITNVLVIAETQRLSRHPEGSHAPPT